MGGVTTEVLAYDDVLNIHEVLVRDFASTADPIQPPGLRGTGDLLQSAVARQHVGLGGTLKHPDPLSNAATLCYGVCCNHAFHNGNKRTALVTLLCHLDRNGFTLQENVSQDELYSFMLKIAAHRFAPKRDKTDSSDIEIEEIKRWLHRNTRRIKKGERVVTFRALRRILRQFDIELENPRHNYIDVVRYEMKRKGLFGPKERVGTRIAHIGYPGDGVEVGRQALKIIREQARLTEQDGYDSEMFYSAETSIDKFVMRYKGTLRRLAKV
jgi:death-on-curing family protein